MQKSQTPRFGKRSASPLGERPWWRARAMADGNVGVAVVSTPLDPSEAK
jgi:hypothetical protein